MAGNFRPSLPRLAMNAAFGFTMTKIRVALADDHPVVLAGVKALIQAAPDIEIAGESTSGAAALSLIRATAPDIAVIDVSMPDITGIDLTRRITEEYGHVRILVLTAYEDRAYVQQLLGNGASGYLLKRSAAEELIRAIRAIHSGGVYIDPAIADRLTNLTNAKQLPQSGAKLSEREEEVLRLAAQGWTNKETAERLGLNIKTVETYRARAAEKLGLRTRAEIVRYGKAAGWLDQS